MPSDADCNSIDWATSYLNYAVGNAFGRLYNNYDGLGDAWAAYWKTVATQYKNLPGVMGYDLMNGKRHVVYLGCFLLEFLLTTEISLLLYRALGRRPHGRSYTFGPW